MPPTVLGESDEAKIELTNDQISYVQGDSLKGHVKRTAAQAIEDATITLRLVGRAEALMLRPIIAPEAGASIYVTWLEYWMKANFLSVESVIISRALISAGDHAWPFTVAIGQPASEGEQTTETFPPTFYCTSDRATNNHKRTYLYIEYVLEVEIASSSSPSVTAEFPITVRWPTTVQPTTDLGMETQAFSQSVRSLHLLPEYSEAHIPLHRHMSTLLGLNEVPQYAFSIHVSHPSIIQLDHPEPISFALHATTNLDPSQTSATFSTQPPPLNLVAVKLWIHSATDNWDFKDVNKERGRQKGVWRDSRLDLPDDFLGRDGLLVPTSNEVTNSDTTHATLDIGEILGLCISSRSISFTSPAPTEDLASTIISEDGIQMAPLKYALYPSFDTRYVSNRHRLVWKLSFSCGGKTHTVEGKAPIIVLGPSQEQEDAESQLLAGLDIKNSHKKHNRGRIISAVGAGAAGIGMGIAAALQS